MFVYAMGVGLGAKGVRPGEGLWEVFDQELSFAWVAGYTIYMKCEWICICPELRQRACETRKERRHQRLLSLTDEYAHIVQSRLTLLLSQPSLSRCLFQFLFSRE